MIITMNIDWSKVDKTTVEIDGMDSRDYPDFCDTFISSVEYKGREATEEELDAITDGWNDNIDSPLCEMAYMSFVDN